MRLCALLRNSALLLVLCAAAGYGRDCPRGLVNAPAPGQCGDYVDANRDGFCDHSQDLAVSTEPIVPAGGKRDEGEPTGGAILFAATVLLCALSEVAGRLYPSSLPPLRHFWNWVLLSSFAVCGLTGLPLLFPGLFKALPHAPYGQMHSASGVVFVAAGFYHAFKRMGQMFPFCRAKTSSKN